MHTTYNEFCFEPGDVYLLRPDESDEFRLPGPNEALVIHADDPLEVASAIESRFNGKYNAEPFFTNRFDFDFDVKNFCPICNTSNPRLYDDPNPCDCDEWYCSANYMYWSCCGQEVCTMDAYYNGDCDEGKFAKQVPVNSDDYNAVCITLRE